MSAHPLIRKLTVARYRGLERFEWRPRAGMNIVLGGGDVGKSTVLDAIALLFSPTNASVVSESDYWLRDTNQEFSIEAVVALPPNSGVNAQTALAWPWSWNGQEAVAPSADGEDAAKLAEDPVYRVRVRGTAELELVWEMVQPNDEADHFSAAVRRKIGLVRLSADERNDRDLRLVYGSALDRLLADPALRPRIAEQVSELDLNESLSQKGTEALGKLDRRLADAALPSSLELGLTTGHGMSIGALVGLLADKHGISLPLASWGSGTRRMAALEIASSTNNDASVTLVDEIERGLEPYRLRKLLGILKARHGQSFVTTHSPVAISCASEAHLWYLDSRGSIGALPHDKIGAQQRRDPETFLARVAVIAEGPTEVGFLRFLLEKAFGCAPLDHGVRVCDGQGNDATLDLLETLASAGVLFAGIADNEGRAPERWRRLKEQLGDRLMQWAGGCTEQHVIQAIAEDKLPELLKVDGEFDGYRLRTLADRIGVRDKDIASLQRTLAARGKTLREAIIEAATGSTVGAPKDAEKAWRNHARDWFKSEAGGRELAAKMVALDAWNRTIQPQLLPLLNAVLTAAGRPARATLNL